MAQVPHELRERRQVIDVLEALADGLQDDGERGVLPGDVEQLLRALALLPQRGALAGVPARQKQRAGRALAEAGGEQRGATYLFRHDICDLVGIEGKEGRIRGFLALRQSQHDTVIAGDRLRIHAGALRHPRAYGKRPRRIDGAAERRVKDQAPVPHFVLEALEQQRLLVRDKPRRVLLLAQVGQQVIARPLVRVNNERRV